MTWHSPIGCGLSFELSWWASFHSSVKTYADWVWHSLQIGELCCIFIGLHRRQRRPPFGLRHLPGVLPHPVFPPLLVRVDGLGRGGAVPSQLRLCFPSFKADEKWPTFQDQQLNNNNRIHSDGNNKNVNLFSMHEMKCWLVYNSGNIIVPLFKCIKNVPVGKTFFWKKSYFDYPYRWAGAGWCTAFSARAVFS